MITVVKSDGPCGCSASEGHDELCSSISQNGITCGLRKDGSRAVLWDDNTVEWFNAAEFSSLEGANV